VSVRTDRAAIGGGPEQATAQAEARFRATVSAVSTANPGLGAGQPCDCETANR
jgi:phage tail protein X